MSTIRDEPATVRTKKKEFLDQTDRIVPWGEWLAIIQPCYYKGEHGNKPSDLSDMATVAEVMNSRAFSEF